MSTQDLKQRLQELHEALQSPQQLDSESIAELTQLREDIELILAQGTAAETANIQEQLERSVQSFAAEHPVLSMTLRRIAQALDNAGI